MRTADAAASGERRFVFLAAALLAAAAVLAYANSFSVPLIFDDWVTLLKNPKLRQLWPIWDALRPPEDTGVGGRPVANLSFVLNYALTGESMAGFHAVNLAIHLGAGLALLGVVRRTLLRVGWSADESVWCALAVAGLWTLQPLHTQSVTYVSQRTESLMGLFYFLTLYGFARVTAAPAARRWSVLTVLSCFAGMATKEGMATAPVIVFLYDWVFVSGSVREAWRRHARLFIALAASWLLLAFLTRGLHGRGVGFGHGMTPWSYLLIEVRAVERYFALSLWPSPLVFDYGVDLDTDAGTTVACAALVISVAAASLWALVRWPAAGFLGLWFFLTLAPTSSVVPLPLQPISENRVYVPSVAVIAAFVLLAHRGGGIRAVRVLLVGLIALIGLTALRNRDYRSEVSIWADTVAKRPASSRAHSNLGHALQSVGRLAEAKAQHEIALQLRPNYSEAHSNLAAIVGQLGDLDAALAHSRRAAELDPRNAGAFYNLGVALSQKGDLAGAIAAYEASLQIRPTSPETHSNLALLFLRTGRAAEAIAQGEQAVKLSPASADGRFAMGCGLVLLGRFNEAVPQLAEALRLRPNFADAHVYLGAALEQLGRVPEAIAEYEAALQLNPAQPGARENLEKLRSARTPPRN